MVLFNYRFSRQFISTALGRWAVNSAKPVAVDLICSDAPLLTGIMREESLSLFDRIVLVTADSKYAEFWNDVISQSKELPDDSLRFLNPLHEEPVSEAVNPMAIPLSPLSNVEVVESDPLQYLYSHLDADCCFYVDMPYRNSPEIGDLFQALSYTDHSLCISGNTSKLQSMRRKYGLIHRLVQVKGNGGDSVMAYARTKRELYPF